MDEAKVLELALQNCQKLERSLYESMRIVRRLNIRYNSEWLLKNYKNYMTTIWSQYSCQSPPETARSSSSVTSMPSTRKREVVQRRTSETALSARSSNELCGSSRQINYKFIKIKRSMEALIVQLQHAIGIANRQKNYVHMNLNGRDSRTRICCH